MEGLTSVGIFGLNEDDVGTFRSVAAARFPHLVRLEAEFREKPAPEVDRGTQVADVDPDVVETDRHAKNRCRVAANAPLRRGIARPVRRATRRSDSSSTSWFIPQPIGRAPGGSNVLVSLPGRWR